MYRRINFITDETTLSKNEWVFLLIDDNLILDTYTQWIKKPTTRSRFKIGNHYNRLMKRDSNIDIDEIPYTKDIEFRAMEELLKDIKTNVKIKKTH